MAKPQADLKRQIQEATGESFKQQFIGEGHEFEVVEVSHWL